MSRWRLRGYVLDSDEEEEDLESCSSHSSSQRPIAIATTTVQRVVENLPADPRPLLRQHHETTPRIEEAPQGQRLNQHQSDSPDPLQATPDATVLGGSKTSGSSQMRGFLNASHIYNLEMLLDSSDSDSLSSPPTDNENDVVFTSPTRNVQVHVIPPSNGVGTNIGTQGGLRSLRARKPIQVHPYLIEGERYRRECQVVGMKPVPRPRSPSEISSQADTGSQVQNDETNSAETIPVQQSSESDKDVVHIDTLELNSSLGRKRRKLIHKRPIQVLQYHEDGVLSSLYPSEEDVWEIPRSPPYSRSPSLSQSSMPAQSTVLPSTRFSVTNLPTPSNSSGMKCNPRFDVQPLPDSDSDCESRNSATLLTTRVRSLSNESDKELSPSSAPGTNSDAHNLEVRKIGKRIKGVLPASWLRLDQAAQGRRITLVREDETFLSSLRRLGPPKGVAQPVSKRSIRKGKTPISSDLSHDTVITVDDSSADDEEAPQHNIDSAFQAALDASNSAAVLNSRYFDDDTEDMEDDRLHLFTLGGHTRQFLPKKTKRQLKLTHSETQSQRPMNSKGGTLRPRISGLVKNPLSSKHLPQKRKPQPPALSIADLNQGAVMKNQAVPQFIRLAIQRSRQRSDQGRQSPTNKYVRLQTIADTEDATTQLQKWKQGALDMAPEALRMKSRLLKRLPLIEMPNNRQQLDTLPTPARHLRRSSITQNKPNIQSRKTLTRRPLPSGIAIRKPRSVPLEIDSSMIDLSVSKALLGPVTSTGPYRAAQLENLEADFSRADDSSIFQRNLHKVNQQFSVRTWGPSANPLLVRFLALEHPAPSSPCALGTKMIGEEMPRVPNATRMPRSLRKPKAQRVEVGLREYRQPSEPTVEHILSSRSNDRSILHGSWHPTTFNTSPIMVGTYFASTTFIGSGELHDALRLDGHPLDTFAGYYRFQYLNDSFECGPWHIETYLRWSAILDSIWLPLADCDIFDRLHCTLFSAVLGNTSAVLRSMVRYLALNISFLDATGYQEFTVKMVELLNDLHTKVLQVHMSIPEAYAHVPGIIRTLTYLMVCAVQVWRMLPQNSAENQFDEILITFIKTVSKSIIQYLVQKGETPLRKFLEKNKSYTERENGIQNCDEFVECVVVSMNTLKHVAIAGWGFWDIVNVELSLCVKSAVQTGSFESIWATLFTLLPFGDFDEFGIPMVTVRSSFGGENWTFIKNILHHVFELYSGTFNTPGTSINAHVRASLERCHVLLYSWQWRKCDPILSVIFDFFAKRGLEQLDHEDDKGSPQFLQDLAREPNLDVQAKDSTFHIFLKLLALGLRGMKQVYTDKRIQSIVLRCTPNHGRSFPKDCSLDHRSLAAFRNHQDLLCTLYWASPPSCRPKLNLLQELVQHDGSHQEVCRLSVRAWTWLTSFQLSQDEHYTSLQSFALWHRTTVQQTMKQYVLAKTEADDFLKNAKLDGTSDISIHMVKSAMIRNQQQVIATLRDCITGMAGSLKYSKSQSDLRKFVDESGVLSLLELPHLEDSRLTTVIKAVLELLREYTLLQRRAPFVPSDQQETQKSGQPNLQQNAYHGGQPPKEESQDYGDFPSMDDLDDTDLSNSNPCLWDFIQAPLWHLLSNAFGAENSPNEIFLEDCINTWVLVADARVSNGEKMWSHYVESFSQVSWQQLRDTTQTRSYKPYYMAAVISCNSAAYDQHRNEFFTALLTSLVERESMLRFQHLLLRSIIARDSTHPLLKNLPFGLGTQAGSMNIEFENLRNQRLTLLSSILANMRDHCQRNVHHNEDLAQIKRSYASMLQECMRTMKNRYQQYCQGKLSTGVGAYVEFVQKMIYSLKQYTSDICAVDRFFTNPSTFLVPTTDPTYVIGGLRGYASKLSNAGMLRQLATFIQAVAQQSSEENQQLRLRSQLSTALTGGDDRLIDIFLLRNVLLRGVIPAYIEVAFSSHIGLLIAQPLLWSLQPILGSLIYDLRVLNENSVEALSEAIWSIYHVFISQADKVAFDTTLLRHSFIVRTLNLMFSAVSSALPTLAYVSGRTSPHRTRPAVIKYISEFASFVAPMMHGIIPHTKPTPLVLEPPRSSYEDLLLFSVQGLNDCLQNNWTEVHDHIYCCHAHGQKEIISDLKATEEEAVALHQAIDTWHRSVEYCFDSEVSAGISHAHMTGETSIGDVSV